MAAAWSTVRGPVAAAPGQRLDRHASSERSSCTTESTTATRSPSVRAATARCRWYDAPRAGMSRTDASSAEQPSRSATGSRRPTRSLQVVGEQRLVGVGVEDDDRVEPVAGGPPLVLLHVPRRHHRQLLAGGQPGVEVDDQAVHQGDEGGEVGERRDAVADPVLQRAQVRRRADVPADLGELVDHAGGELRRRRTPRTPTTCVNWNGSPAVGSCWNISARLEA